LTQQSGNVALNEMLPSLHDRSRRIWHLHGWSDEDFVRTQCEHEAILKSITAGDKAGASLAILFQLAQIPGSADADGDAQED
jgi:DNA-binding FadR family transcriptional regulator